MQTQMEFSIAFTEIIMINLTKDVLQFWLTIINV